jgi:NAD(P)-dependent dehydrogenase (short-subunit alcohol dehydrogenase family)
MVVDLGGRTALVAGASRGIGLAIAQALADAGARVVLTARTSEAAEAAAATIGEPAIGFGAHALDADAAAACVRFTLERLGRLDVLVNNVGTNPAFGPLVDVDHARFAKTLDVNLWAPLLWTGHAWRAWMREHGGAIVNTASLGALITGAQLGVYHAAKAGLVHLTNHLARELAPRVRVNAVAPGIVRTRLSAALWRDQEERLAATLPLGRIGEPADIAPAVAFLASDAAAWITGETIVLDGGHRVSAYGVEGVDPPRTD